MTSSNRPTSGGLRSLVAVAAVGAVALSTYLAPIATAATTVDPNGTVTVTADPGAATSTPAEAVAPAAPTTTTGTATAAKPSAPTPTTPKPSACTTATPAAPWRLVATRDAEDPTAAKVEWAAVACATRYNVSVMVDGKDDVNVVDAATTTYTVTGSSTAKTYKIQVSSRNDAGQGASTQVYYLRPSVPAGVTGMKVTYDDLSAAILSWKAPIDRQPKSYQLLVTRVADKKVIIDQELDGAATSAGLPGLDARGMFVITLQAMNASGPGPKSRLVIGDENPNPVKSIAAIRDPGNPGMVIVSWLPSDNTLKGTVIGYEIGYGSHSANERVFVKATDGTVSIPADKSTVVIVRVVTDHGKSRWSKAVRIPIDGNRNTTTTNTSIDLVEQDGVVTIAASQGLANDFKLMVKILPTAANGGFTDTQYSQGGANFLSFRTVPEGSYVVTVEGGGRELARRYLNIGKVGMMFPSDWKVITGYANISDTTVDLPKAGETRVLSTRARTTQDVVIETDAQLTTGDGYGFWLRTSNLETRPTGLSFQYDPKWNSAFIIRQWQNGTECSKPIASTPFPKGLNINGVHRIVMAAQGDTLFATLDGVKLFDVPSLSAAIAGNSCKYAAPTGTQVGLRKWTTSQVIFKNTTIQ